MKHVKGGGKTRRIMVPRSSVKIRSSFFVCSDDLV